MKFFRKKIIIPGFEPLISMTVSGVETILSEIRKAYPTRSNYAYVLTTYSGLEGFGFHANDLDTYEVILQKAGCYENPKRAEKYEEFKYYKWYWGEWGDNEFIGNQDPLGPTWTWLTEQCSSLDKKYPDSDDWFELFSQATQDAMVEILKRLDERKAFGVGAERENCLIYAGIYDDDDDLILRSVKMLNSDKTIRQLWPDIEKGF